MSDKLDPDQARPFVGPDLDPNCLQMLSAYDTNNKQFGSNVEPNLGPNCLQRL